MRKSEISSSGEVGLCVATTRLDVAGVEATVLTPVAAFFLDFPKTHLGAAVDLGSVFLGPAVSVLSVTVGFSSASVTSCVVRLEFGLVSSVVVAFTKRPLGRDSTPRAGPSAR